MSFHSLDYLLFLPLVVVLYFCTPQGWRWVILLALSNLFYAAWRWDFLWLLWVSTLIDYVVGQMLPRVRPGWRRKALLAVSLCGNLGLLFTFKYFALVANTGLTLVHGGDSQAFEPISLLLPLGISFYTFQTLGYVIDVYRGRKEPERHLGYFAVYVMYFPQLLAGPIERPGTLLPQFRQHKVFEVGRAAAGGALMLVGYFKKLVIADRLADIVPPVLNQPLDHSPLLVLTAAVGEIYRYYADLSGYADIAIGSSLILGIQLTRNFDRPLASVSVAEFWRRWHITVSTWFRDYVYLPIARGGGRGRGRRDDKAVRRAVATLITIAIVALWHGAAWTWLAAGVIAGLVMIGEGIVRRSRAAVTFSRGVARTLGLPRGVEVGLQDSLNRLVLWSFLILLGSMVATPSWQLAIQAWGRMVELPAWAIQDPGALISGFNIMPRYLVMAIVALEIFQWFDCRRSVFERLKARGPVVAWGFYYVLIAVILMFGTFDKPGFLYFNF